MTDKNAAASRPSRTAPTAGMRARRLIFWGAIAAVAAIVLTGSLVYTEQSSFCPTCHEMRPYYTAWQAGGHARSSSCVDCHVDPGVVAHLAHKPIALKEVWDHFFRDNRFPNYTVEIPNARCLGCHPDVQMKIGAVFSHKSHETYGRCIRCHAQAGHAVSLASLRAEGVLKTNATNPPQPTGAAGSSTPSHIKVICQDCHDQAKMKCGSCHQAPHNSRGECSNCHQPGSGFVFTHPVDGDCGSCHTPPADHFGPGCGACHKVGEKFIFTHPSDRHCETCHTAPANHFGPDCAGCHKTGTPFARATFVHKGNTGEHSYRSFACAKCHPRGYATASCTCHGGNRPG